MSVFIWIHLFTKGIQIENLYQIIFIFSYDYRKISLFYYLLTLCINCSNLFIHVFYTMDFSLTDVLLFISSDLNFTGEFLYMDGGENTSNFFPSSGENPTGGTPGGGPNYGNDIATVAPADENNRVRRSNPMNFTQMCNPTIETMYESPEPLSKESLRRVHDVLYEEQHNYWNNNPDKMNKAVNFSKLGYNFQTNTGTVMSELKVLRDTNNNFAHLKGPVNVDKVIQYCRKNM